MITEYLGAIVALLGLSSIIMKYFLSGEADRVVRRRQLDAIERQEQEAINTEVNEQAVLTEGAGKAWSADENENQKP